VAANTPFPLGIYVGNPNGNSVSANATFEANFQSFEATMGGAKPAYMDAFVDPTLDPSQWAGSAGWSAWSWNKTGNAFVGPGSGVTPVVGVPLASTAGGWSKVDAFYKGIIAGTYDADYRGIVDGWAAQGYKTFQLRLGYEFNGNFMDWAPGNSSSPTANADFIAAWQHVANIVHAEGKTDGVTVQTVWNPDEVNWAPTAPAKLYPGDQYVDIISTDAYSPTYPLDFTNWSVSNSQQSPNATAWAAIAANREHFWQYPDATRYATTGDGAGWSVQYSIAFAAAHGKPISISETGAGGNGGALGPADDPAFPQWLAGELATAQAAGVKVQNVNIWAISESDGNWGFLNGAKPQEAAAWGKYFGAGAGAGSAPNPTITLSPPGTVQEASLGAGVTITETIDTTDLSGKVYLEVLTSTGAQESAYTPVTLTNGTASVAVHLAKSGDKIQVANSPTTPTVTAVSSPVTITDTAAPATETIGSGSDTLALHLSEDAGTGNAQFTISIDGTQIGGTQTVTAAHSTGQSQTFNVLGTFSSGTHSVAINFLNPVSGSVHPNASVLYVTGATIDGATVPAATVSENTLTPQRFSFMEPVKSGSADTVTVNRPASLKASVQTITGTETDASQSVFLDWRTTGTPTLSAGDWVEATTSSNGSFSALIDIDHAGTKSTMFYRVGSAAAVAAWSATPS
jgi:hypothetical protein